MAETEKSRLQIIGKAQRPGYVRCRCKCGTEKEVRKAHMNAGRTLSCGCLATELRRKLLTKHGHFGTPVYQTWAQMISRCTNPKSKSFQRYGARGIGVCDRWQAFESFLEDMGERPDSHSLDRIDNDRGYEPGNCRWATTQEQARNKRSNTIIELPSGERLKTWEYAERLGVSLKAAWGRANRRGHIRR